MHNDSSTSGYVPEVDSLYVQTETYKRIDDIINSGLFYPTLLTGPSGTGKTFTVEQSCATKKREVFRVNITIESDEDALMGGFRLQDGNTVFETGPVVKAMEAGAVLLLDEVDLASPSKIMCLQSVMEGKGYYIKRIQKWVQPKEGFQIFATANTKGLGDDTGQFIATQNLNEAFLERFPATFEVDYPPPAVEKEILTLLSKSLKIEVKDFISTLIQLATQIRAGSKSGEYDFTMSTRRLTHILRAYKIWKHEVKALEACFARYPDHVKNAWLDAYKVLAPVSKKELEADRKRVMDDLNMDQFKPY